MRNWFSIDNSNRVAAGSEFPSTDSWLVLRASWAISGRNCLCNDPRQTSLLAYSQILVWLEDCCPSYRVLSTITRCLCPQVYLHHCTDPHYYTPEPHGIRRCRSRRDWSRNVLTFRWLPYLRHQTPSNQRSILMRQSRHTWHVRPAWVYEIFPRRISHRPRLVYGTSDLPTSSIWFPPTSWCLDVLMATSL